ncbi:MAG: hypothetical protein ACPL5F_13310 [Moorellaceae bacterium]
MLEEILFWIARLAMIVHTWARDRAIDLSYRRVLREIHAQKESGT